MGTSGIHPVVQESTNKFAQENKVVFWQGTEHTSGITIGAIGHQGKCWDLFIRHPVEGSQEHSFQDPLQKKQQNGEDPCISMGIPIAVAIPFRAVGSSRIDR